MRDLDRALAELYIVAEAPEDAQNHLENAIEHIEDAVEEIGPKMVSEELIELIQNLSNGSDVEPIIYELEVLNNEL